MKRVKGTPTALNVRVLAKAFAVRNGIARGIEARFEAVDHPHIKRCLDAGLCAVDTSGWLKLTDAGLEATREQRAEIFHKAIKENVEKLYRGAWGGESFERFNENQACFWAAIDEDPAVKTLVSAAIRKDIDAKETACTPVI